MGEVPTAEVAAIVAHQITTAEAVTTEGIVPAIGTVVAEEEAMEEIRGRPGTITTGIPDKITIAREEVAATSGTIPTRIHGIVVLRTARGHAQNTRLRRAVAETMAVVAAADAEITTEGMVAVLAEALPVGTTTMVAAHPTTNVAMIIIIRRRLVAAVVAVAAAVVVAVIEWIIAAAAEDAVTDPGNRWDHPDRWPLVAALGGDRRCARRWVLRVARHRCRRCAGVVRHEVGLRVVSGTMDAVG